MASIILYPMIGLSGLFVPFEEIPPAMRMVTHLVPLTYMVSLLEGIWVREIWSVSLWSFWCAR